MIETLSLFFLIKKDPLIDLDRSKDDRLCAERVSPRPQLTGTSESDQIFIGSVSQEHRGSEQSVIGDVKYLSVYLVWQRPQVRARCWFPQATLKASFLLSPHRTNSQPQGERRHKCAFKEWKKHMCEGSLGLISIVNPSVSCRTINVVGFVLVILALQGSVPLYILTDSANRGRNLLRGLCTYWNAEPGFWKYHMGKWVIECTAWKSEHLLLKTSSKRLLYTLPSTDPPLLLVRVDTGKTATSVWKLGSFSTLPY